jgi:hypothetical protein
MCGAGDIVVGLAGHKDSQPAIPVYSWQQNAQCRLHYIRDADEADLALSTVGRGPFGFDLEWKPNRRKNEPQNRVALVQLASPDSIVLLQVSAMSSKLTALLIELPHRCVI